MAGGATGRFGTLRRLPLEMFAFGSDLATTAPDDLRLTEVLMTRGSDSMAVPKKLDAKGCFPIDEKSVARRLAREMGFSKSVSEYHRHYRRCAKGAILLFERPGRPPLFSMPEDASATFASTTSAAPKTPAGSPCWAASEPRRSRTVRSMGEGDDVTKKLILVYDLDEAPVPLKIEVEHEGRPAKMLIPAYRIARVSDLETLAGLMSDPRGRRSEPLA